MSATRTVEAVIRYEDLEIAERPPSGWDPTSDAGADHIRSALRKLFGALGGVADIAVQPERAIVRLKVRSTPDAAKLLDKGIKQAESGKIGAAIETFARAARSDPANAEAHFNLGIGYLERGDPLAAAAPLARAIALSSQPTANMLLGVGNVARKVGSLPRACDFYRRADALDAANPVIERNLATVLAEMGDLGSAEQMFRRAQEHAPKSPEVALGLGLVLSLRDEQEAAVTQFERALDWSRGQGAVGTRARQELARLRPVSEHADNGRVRTVTNGAVHGPHPKLLPITEKILQDSAGNTGIGFEFLMRKDLVAHAMIQIARGGMARHRIVYRPDAGSLDYIVAHEVGHIVRLWTVPSEERLLPGASIDAKVRAIHQLGQEFADLAINSRLQPEHLAKLFDMLYPGAIRQVANFPIDIRIERWIHGEYPQLRTLQRAELLSQVKENSQVLASKMRTTTPPTVLIASNAMNCAFAIAVAELYEDDEIAAVYSDTEYWSTGNDLLRMIDDAADNATGDVGLVDAWAERLHIRDWYRWGRIDEMSAADAFVDG